MVYGYRDMLDTEFLRNLNPEENLTLAVARQVTNPQYDNADIKEIITQNNVNWEKFNGLIVYHELVPFAYSCLKKYAYLVPKEETEFLKNSYYSCITHIAFLWQEFMRINSNFQEKGIRPVPIKGVAFLADNLYNGKSYLRPMGDIDILIKNEDFLLAEGIMIKAEYRKMLAGRKEEYWKTKNYHLGFIRGTEGQAQYNVEIHWALDYHRQRPVLPELWGRLRKSQVEGQDIFMLSAEDTLFSLALHQRRFGKMLCLKNACDVAALLKKTNAVFDWDYVLREAKSGQMRTAIYFVLSQAKLLLNIPIPAFVLFSLGLPRWRKRLIEQFILKKTFSSDREFKNINSLFLKCHFLIYDNLWEPIRYILHIPQEQFAKFYKLEPYAKKTNFLYRIRFPYFLINIFIILLKVLIVKIGEQSRRNSGIQGAQLYIRA